MSLVRRVHLHQIAIASLLASATLAIAALAMAQTVTAATAPTAAPVPTKQGVVMPSCPVPVAPTIEPRLVCPPPGMPRSIPGAIPTPVVLPTSPVVTRGGSSTSGLPRRSLSGTGAIVGNTPPATLSAGQRHASLLAAERAAADATLSPSMPLPQVLLITAGAVVLCVLVPATIAWRRRGASA